MADHERALAYCRAWLPRVSRSFAPSIAQLGMPLELPVGIAYLLCRVVDTVEDSRELQPVEREGLFAGFRAALNREGAVERFCGDAARSFAERADDEAELMRDAAELFGCYHGLPDAERAALEPWIDEMAAGMAEYAARLQGDELVVLEDEDDLHRYCHYVAGTVGGLLTDLFLLHGEGIDEATERALRNRAESFAQGLQQVNIAKDLAGDHRRGWQFLPRSFCVGVDPEKLLDPACRAAALEAHGRLCDLAEAELERALEYTLLLPPGSAARRFCTLPLLMARATFRELRDNEAVLNPDRTVKITRLEAMELIRFTSESARDDAALRALYLELGSSVLGAGSAGAEGERGGEGRSTGASAPNDAAGSV